MTSGFGRPTATASAARKQASGQRPKSRHQSPTVDVVEVTAGDRVTDDNDVLHRLKSIQNLSKAYI